MIRTETQPEPILQERIEERTNPFGDETEISALDMLLLLVERKRFVMRFVLGAFLLAVVVSLLLPIRYEAKIVLLPPQQNSSIGFMLSGQLGGALGALGALRSPDHEALRVFVVFFFGRRRRRTRLNDAHRIIGHRLR